MDVHAENKMGVMPVNRLLLTMSVPIMISMLVQALYNVVDSMFVAQLNENALTAVSLAFPAQCSSLLSYHTAAAGKSAPLPGGPFRGMLLITTKIHPLCPGGACHEKQTFQRILPKAGPPPAFCLAALHALCLSAGLHRISCRCGCRLLHRLTWLRSLVFMKIGHTPCGCGLFYAYLSSSPKAIFHSSTRSTA